MDQMIVDVNHIDNVHMGYEFVILGKQGRNQITVENIAEKCYTNCYELISRLGGRLEKRYI